MSYFINKLKEKRQAVIGKDGMTGEIQAELLDVLIKEFEVDIAQDRERREMLRRLSRTMMTFSRRVKMSETDEKTIEAILAKYSAS